MFKFQDQASDTIYEDAYEYAQEEGYVRWMRATSTDPGCYDRYVDCDIDFRPMVDDDGVILSSAVSFVADAKATVGKRVLFEREYTFSVIRDRLYADYEER